MSYQHAIVWLDHREAKVIDFTFDDQHTHTIVNEHAPRHVHNKRAGGRDPHDEQFFEEVFHAFGTAGEILLVGPANTKHDLRKHIEHRHAAEAKRIVGVENLDHPTAGELLKHARTYFKKYDSLH